MEPYELADPDDDRYREDQLRPVKGGRYQTVLHGPPGTGIGDLHCHLLPDPDGSVVTQSGWQPSPEQIEQLRQGGHIRLSVWQHPIPPLAVGVEPPIDADGNVTMWDSEAGQFVTPQEVARDDSSRAAHDQAKRDFIETVPDHDDDGA